jgi:hypothetical protein
MNFFYPFSANFVNFAFHEATAFTWICNLQQYKVLGGYRFQDFGAQMLPNKQKIA